MHHDLRRYDDPTSLAQAGARLVAEKARAAVSDHGHFTMACSGGKTPWLMYSVLADEDLPWGRSTLYQVDERVAPDDDPERNLRHLSECLAKVRPDIRPMPVTEEPLSEAAARYAEALPERFDVIHLGLGPDGHTASLVPNDPVLATTDQLVGITAPYQDHVRMTLTFPALKRGEQLLWLVDGETKHDALRWLLANDSSIPASRVVAQRSLILADQAAIRSSQTD